MKTRVHVETTPSDDKAVWQIGVMTYNVLMMIGE
jgi:hypothetical protein